VTRLEQALDELAKVQTIPSLDLYVHELRTTFSLANVAFHLVSAPRADKRNPLLMVTYDQDWVTRYVSEDYFRIDPIVLAGSSSFLPIDWDEVDRSAPRIHELFREAESYGVGNRGLTVPVRGPTREKSLLTVTTFDTDQTWSKRRLPLLRDMHIIAHFIHDRCMKLSALRTRHPPKLSPREMQCIEGLARGRAPKQIAYELGISVSAVRLYVRSAKVKLGAVNTTEAIAKAIMNEIVVC
jgi:DNA-binding CsgD family transcriptional regulator